MTKALLRINHKLFANLDYNNISIYFVEDQKHNFYEINIKKFIIYAHLNYTPLSNITSSFKEQPYVQK